jgi:deferrochelatase/peroxidase EfeB
MLYAEPGGLAAWRRKALGPSFDSAFDVLEELGSTDMKGREPFGFVDGVSQPRMDWTGGRGAGASNELEYGNVIAAGEVLLGYRNEYGLYTDRPLLAPSEDPKGVLPPADDDPGVRDLGRNGAYLVFRQLDQDVRAFWRFLGTQFGPEEALAHAELMVGRKMTGEALVPASGQAIAGVGPDPEDVRRNGFTFADDPDGLTCPLGAHVRRANPRTADMPGGDQGVLTQLVRMLGLVNDPPRADVIASTRFHRILRRGREYGQAIDPGVAMRPDAPDPGSGLYFICLNANIARQFEFLQNSWINSAKFAGLDAEQDPLLGSRRPQPPGVATDGFTFPSRAGPCRRITGLPRFVSVRGGAYFFMPGIRALRYLAA